MTLLITWLSLIVSLCHSHLLSDQKLLLMLRMLAEVKITDMKQVEMEIAILDYEQLAEPVAVVSYALLVLAAVEDAGVN